MNEITTPPPSWGETHLWTYQWKALQLFNHYRVLLAISFIIISKLNTEINFFGTIDNRLYQEISLPYVAVSLIILCISLFFRRYYEWQANGPIFIDILVIILLMHASGGILSGVGILLIVIIAAHSLLAPGKLPIFSAAIATIALLLEHTYGVFTQQMPVNQYTQVGLLGLVILVTSWVINVLSRRIRKSQLIVENQAQQLATSQQLNAHIISAMHPGVIVLDYHQQIRLINTAAKRLLGDLQPSIETVADLGVPFSEALQAWKAEGKNNIVKQMAPSSPEARLSFHPLGKGLPTGTLVFIYDADKETQHAQDLKLASLGQLTANIAHELRNPLGAVSHAAQLLGESKDLTSEDARLGNMIKQHCDRMNTVIQNVLSLSSRKPAHHQTISLVPWLEQFIKELAIPFIPDPQVTLHVPQQDILVHIDPTQFTQILINLCENGLRYSLRKNNEATLTIQVHCSGSPPKVFIDILDQGEGIPPSQVSHLFEPFFTTEQTGSGLGLYIARELSQMNGARLDYAPSNQGTQFRLTIPQGGASL